MPKVRVEGLTMSLDGYSSGPNQCLDHPLGVGGTSLHEWLIGTRTFQSLFGGGAGTTGIDDEIAARGSENIGASIMGRNMFGPVRGPWPDESWKGWWGDNPPYHTAVFVLTHHPRTSIDMEGGTTFHFVTDGIHGALDKARQAAGGKDIRIGGGASTVRQFLAAALIDELNLVVSPVLLGSGEALLAGLDLPKLGYQCTKHVATPNALHVSIRKA